jgi:hypothetical protein
LQLGGAHAALGRPARGLPFFERALAIASSRAPTDAYSAGREAQVNVRRQLAGVLWQLGRERARARALARDALELARGGGAEMDGPRAELEAWLVARGGR